MVYKFKYKRRGLLSLFSRCVAVIGHQYLPDQDKMVLFKQDGSLEEVVRWKDCTVTLGTDWVAATKKKMEQEAGATIPLNV